MAVCSVATRTSAVPTAARGPSVYGTAARKLQLKTIEVYNTTTTACAVGVARASATGTQGAGLTEIATSDDTATIVGTGFNTHTADATVGACIRQASLGAQIGSGIIWTWLPGEFILSAATTAGAVIVCPTGTGQHLDFTIEWWE